MPNTADLIVHDVSLRDGIQSEPVYIPLPNRLRLVESLIAAGLKNIQVGSFVHPTRVPQMKEVEAFIHLLPQHEDVSYSGLVLNEKGLDRFLATPLQQLDLSLSCSETHSLKNTGLSLATASAQLIRMIPKAKAAGRRVRVGLQSVFGCAYEGRIATDRIIQMTQLLIDAGADSICWADSTGMALPHEIRRLTQIFFSLFDRPLILHLHDTRGLAMANFVCAYDVGVREFDAAIGGVGGCPYIPGAAGNIATEDMLAYCQQTGIVTGIDLQQLVAATLLLEKLLDYPLPGKIYQLEKKLRFRSHSCEPAAGQSV